MIKGEKWLTRNIWVNDLVSFDGRVLTNKKFGFVFGCSKKLIGKLFLFIFNPVHSAKFICHENIVRNVYKLVHTERIKDSNMFPVAGKLCLQVTQITCYGYNAKIWRQSYLLEVIFSIFFCFASAVPHFDFLYKIELKLFSLLFYSITFIQTHSLYI